MFRLCQQTLRVCYQVAVIDHRSVLGLVGLVGRILLVWQLLLVTVDQLLNPFLLSNRDVKRSLAGGRSDMYAISKKTSQVFSLTTLENNRLEVFFARQLRSELQNQCQPNFPAF